MYLFNITEEGLTFFNDSKSGNCLTAILIWIFAEAAIVVPVVCKIKYRAISIKSTLSINLLKYIYIYIYMSGV